MKNEEFDKVAGDMAEYISQSQDIITSLKAENAELRDTASTQKTASTSPVIDQDSLINMVDNVIGAGILKEADRQTSIDAVNADPNALVNFVDRLASRTTLEKQASAVQSLGRPAGPETTQKTASVRESDAHYQNLCNSLRGRS